MPIDPKLASAIDKVCGDLPDVIESLQERRDYSKKPMFASYVSLLNGFKQQLLTIKATPSPSTEALGKLGGLTQGLVLPMLESLISENLIMSQMGPLNTERTIEPKEALAQNVKLAALQNDLQTMLAYLPQDRRTVVASRVVRSKLSASN